MATQYLDLAGISEKIGKSLFSDTELTRQGRDLFGLSTPVIYWIGWLFVAYIFIYIIAQYIAPVIFGTYPLGHAIYIPRSSQYSSHPGMMNTFVRQRRGVIANMNELEGIDLTARVTNAKPY